MRRLLFCVAGAGSLALLLAAGGRTSALRVHPDAPLPAHTGGFGEPTCLQCHFDGALNEPGGRLRVDGFPEAYAPGETYTLDVRVAHEAMERGGFQMAARFAEGEHKGGQAGHFATGKADVTVDLAEGVEYVRQTASEPAPDSAKWIVRWTAPDTAGGAVVFHAAANASNGDASPFGDYVYTWEAVTRHP